MGKRIEIDRDWLYQKYIEEELSCAKIGKLIGASDHTILDRLKEYGIPTRSNKKTSSDTIKNIINDYNNGIGVTVLGKKYNLHRITIQKLLKNNGIELRGYSPVKGYHNIHFFDAYTIESCYWAGFIAADGNVQKDKNVNIKLALKDKEHLQKFAKLINFQGNILEGTEGDQNQFHWCRINISGKWFIKALAKNFNIFPNKTFTISIPSQMPEEFLPHYLRGYFDGDGSVIMTATHQLRIDYTSGSKDLLNSITNYFYNKGIRVKKTHLNLTEKPFIQNEIHINYSGQNAIKILHILYDESTEDTRLTRKYERFINYIKEQKNG